ncbi:MAG: hypothetical protein KC656_24765 [Myxococcales bacterium]|nr:hypothetical protein [Myxococcales bacterium]
MHARAPASLVLLLLAACAPASREAYVADAALGVCDALDACGRIGEDQPHDDLDDCTHDWEDLFDVAWPASACQAEDIDRADYDECLSDARTWACENDLANFADAVEACRPARVCGD